MCTGMILIILALAYMSLTPDPGSALTINNQVHYYQDKLNSQYCHKDFDFACGRVVIIQRFQTSRECWKAVLEPRNCQGPAP